MCEDYTRVFYFEDVIMTETLKGNKLTTQLFGLYTHYYNTEHVLMKDTHSLNQHFV